MSKPWTGERLARVPLGIFGGVVAVTGGTFLGSSLAMSGGWHRAWEIMLGLSTPFGQDAGLGFALSLLGYLFVPTAIGLAVADSISRFTRRRLLSLPEAQAQIAEAVAAAEKTQDPVQKASAGRTEAGL